MTPDPSYPIGKFEPKENYSPEEINSNIDRITALPEKIEKAIQGLSEAQLDTSYRDGGWTLRQVVHHVADSHSNAYIRFKWTLTEESPLIKAYFEKPWAETPETKASPMLSIAVLKALHAKWIVLIRSLSATDLERDFTHPETGKKISLIRLLALYAWHGDHHTAHITTLRKAKQW